MHFFGGTESGATAHGATMELLQFTENGNQAESVYMDQDRLAGTGEEYLTSHPQGNSIDKTFYVYLIQDPVTLDPIYIGKGCGNRMLKHWRTMTQWSSPVGNAKLYRRLTELFNTGCAPFYQKLFESTDPAECLKVEHLWIALIGLENLCNIQLTG
jgi:hypothetical protein